MTTPEGDDDPKRSSSRSVPVILVSALLALMGCDSDRSMESDGGLMDAGEERDGASETDASGCEPFAGYETCGALCPGAECTVDRTSCEEEQGVCVPGARRSESRGTPWCYLNRELSGEREYCWNDQRV